MQNVDIAPVGSPGPFQLNQSPGNQELLREFRDKMSCLHLIYSSVIICLGGRHMGHSLEPGIGLLFSLQFNTMFC